MDRMNKLAILLFLTGPVFAAAFTGCLPVTKSSLSDNQPPTAVIDSVTPTEVAYGERVAFVGHGVDADGSVVAYVWRSSIDGELSESASFETSSLSRGTHTVWFKVQDDKGAWSAEVPVVVMVVPQGVLKPNIRTFVAEPSTITEGKPSVLSWNVSGANAVTIEPGIGNVPVVGSRTVTPAKTTTYLLMASNDAGTVSTTVQVVVVSTSPVRRLELYSIVGEEGQVRKDGYVGPEVQVGDVKNGTPIQAFLSFDISMIPQGAIIKSAYLDLTGASVFGEPFRNLGMLRVYECRYGVLSSKDFAVGSGPGIPLHSFSFLVDEPVTSSLLVSAIQDRVKEGSGRFQLRLQFDKPSFYNNQGDYVALWEGKSRLVIEYQE